MKKTYLFLALILGAFQSLAQQTDIPFDKNNFPKEQKKEFKEAMDHFEEGDGYMADLAYHKAIDYYQQAYKFNPHSAELNFKMGVCYLLSPHDDKTECLRYFAYSYELNPNQSQDIHYYLGRGNHLLKKWDEAIKEYKEFMKYSQEAPMYDYASVFKRIEECKTGKRMSAKEPTRVFIDNLGSIVNSTYPEYCPIVTTDESMMVFTAKRPTTEGGEQGMDYHFYEDIYVSHKINGVWTKAENLGDPVNNKYNDATVGLSPDGSKMLIFREGDLYECDFEGTNWSSPKDLGDNINTKKHKEASASFSFDGKQLYFTSNRPDLSRGGMDIFVSDWDEDEEEWGAPRNLGFNINTEFDEEGVFIHPDGKTMYFSSRGHDTMGGYDIFKSEYSDEKQAWGVPTNIGMPVNTPDDDIFFVINGSGKRAYYSSVRKDNIGEEDLYKITFLGPEKEMVLNTEDILIASTAKPTTNLVVEREIEIVSNDLTLFKGKTLDEETKKPVGASIEITDNSNATEVGTFNSNSSTGNFLVTLPAGKNYGIAVKAPGYLFHSENFDIPKSNGYQEVEKIIYLKPIKEGKKIVLRNIFFDFDKATLRKESKKELQNMVELLNNNPSLRVELSGHTDNIGSDSYNLDLSQRRAQAVVDYLVKNGISKSKLEAKGYGEKDPIATNKTDSGRQQNRRTEFKVIK